jgi:hypothetical protein
LLAEAAVVVDTVSKPQLNAAIRDRRRAGRHQRATSTGMDDGWRRR